MRKGLFQAGFQSLAEMRAKAEWAGGKENGERCFSKMHEAGLMQQVLKTVQKSAGENNIRQVTKITLSVGKLTMALPEALHFAFDALSRGTIFAGAELEIEQPELCLRCSVCELTFTPPEIDFQCPVCGGTRTEILVGHELCILSYEGEAEKIESDYCPKTAPGK